MANTKVTSAVIEAGAILNTHIASGAISSGHLSGINTGAVAEGSNLYYTDARAQTRARASISVTGGNLAYDSSTGVLQLTDNEIRDAISAGGNLSYNNSTGVMSYTTPTMYTDADAQGAITVTDAGGDGSLAYSGGTITYTGPSAAEVRAHLSAGNALSYSSGQFAVVAPTASGGTNTTALATTAFVQQELTTLIGGAPSTLNDLNELAAAINDDANYNSTLTTALATKAPLASPAFNSGATNVVASFTSTDSYGGIQLADNAGNVELTAVGNDFHIQNAGAAAKMVVLNSGNVGIATATPDYTLEVVGDSMIGDASAVTSPVFVAQQQIVKSFTYGATGAGRGGNLYLLNTNTNGDAGLLTFGGYSNHTNNLYYQTGAVGGGTEAQDGGSWGGYLSFITTSDGSKGAASGMYEQMRITADGHVQIKQTGSAPTNGVMMPGHIEFKGQGWDSNSGSDDMNVKIEMAATYGKVGSGATSPELVFSLQGAGGLDASSESYVEGMRLVGAGAYNNNQPRLGIGTASPTKALDVYTNTNTGGIQITGGTSATNTSLHISNAGSSGSNWNITSTGGGHGYGDGHLHFGIAYGVPKMKITSSGNVGIGHATGAHVPQKVLEVECPSEDFVTLGARTLGVSNNWAGIHFGYKENNNNYRKSAIVFERTDLTSGNAQGKVHIFNGPQAGAGSATLADSAFRINEDGSVILGRDRALSSETTYSQQPFQFDLDFHVNGTDEAAEEKDAVFSKIWRKSAVLHPGKYSNGNYYVGIGISPSDTVNYVVFKLNLDKAHSLFASAFATNSADGQSRSNKIYYSTDDTNWTSLVSNTFAAGSNTASSVLDLKTLAGFQGQTTTGQGNFFTGTIFIKFALEGGSSGHTNLIGWQSFTIRATAQHASLTGGGFGRSKNDLTLSGQANTGHGYAPLSHAYGHQYSGTNETAIISANAGTQTFASKGFGHAELAIFQPCTVASIGANGLQVMADGIMHMSFNQDIITAGDTSYCSLMVRRYNEGMNAGIVVGSTLIKNTNGHWDMLVGNFIFDVRAGDVITCTITGSSILSLDGGTWSNYNFMLMPSAITSQGNAGSTHLPWLKN